MATRKDGPLEYHGCLDEKLWPPETARCRACSRHQRTNQVTVGWGSTRTRLSVTAPSAPCIWQPRHAQRQSSKALTIASNNESKSLPHSNTSSDCWCTTLVGCGGPCRGRGKIHCGGRGSLAPPQNGGVVVGKRGSRGARAPVLSVVHGLQNTVHHEYASHRHVGPDTGLLWGFCPLGNRLSPGSPFWGGAGKGIE